MRLFDKYSCIFCKYRKYNKNHDGACMGVLGYDDYGYPLVECNSLSNIFHGKVLKHFPFKQIDILITDLSYRKEMRAIKKEEKYNKKMDKKYGDSGIENDDYMFVWGVYSIDMPEHKADMNTANDIEIVYDKHEDEYILYVNAGWVFKSREDECDYLRDCLAAFTKYMDDHELNKYDPYELLMPNLCTTTAGTIEELYANFKIFVDGFCSQNFDVETENNYV
jgi:hypothetical protein